MLLSITLSPQKIDTKRKNILAIKHWHIDRYKKSSSRPMKCCLTGVTDEGKMFSNKSNRNLIFSSKNKSKICCKYKIDCWIVVKVAIVIAKHTL